MLDVTTPLETFLSVIVEAREESRNDRSRVIRRLWRTALGKERLPRKEHTKQME